MKSLTTILLDGNIYDQLATDAYTRTMLAMLVAKGSIRVIATPTVVHELSKSPFGGLPTWFPVDLEPERHGAKPNLVSDAIIADSAHALADILVSEDHGCRWRLTQLSTRCKAISYAELRSWLSRAPGR